MRKFLLFLLPFLLHAGIIQDFVNKKYSKICTINNLHKVKSEKLLSIIGVSCVKTDNLYLLPFIIDRLKHTKAARINAIYFASILLQKKLLYGFIFDKFSLNDFSFPKIKYILSIVFENLKNHHYHVKKGVYIIKLPNETIKFYKSKDKMIIDEYKNGKLFKTHWFR
jgi:hypothetical protein